MEARAIKKAMKLSKDWSNCEDARRLAHEIGIIVTNNTDVVVLYRYGVQLCGMIGAAETRQRDCANVCCEVMDVFDDICSPHRIALQDLWMMFDSAAK